MTDFRTRTLNALKWSVGSHVGRQAVSFAVGITLARLLSPDVFGQIGMVIVVTGFVSVMTDFGFSAALVQHDDVEERHLSTVFWLNVVLGALLTAAFFFAAPLVAAFYDNESLEPIAAGLSVGFVIGSFGVVHRTLLTKHLKFRRLAFVEVAAVIASGAIAIALAISGFGVWVLVAHNLCVLGIATALLWVRAEWSPKFMFEWKALGELFGFSAALFGTQTLQYWARNLDDLVVGRSFGDAALGAYNRAYSIMLFPLENVSRVIGRVMFPALSLVKADSERVRNVHLNAVAVIALVTFPMMWGVYAVSDLFVIGLLGDQWIDVIPILEILCFVGLVQSVITLNGALFLSQGRSDLQFKIGIAVTIVTLAGILGGLPWGPTGVAWGYAAANLICHYPTFRLAGGLVGLRYRDLVRAVAGVFACATTMGLVLLWFRSVVTFDLPVTIDLFVHVAIGVAIYGVLILAFKVKVAWVAVGHLKGAMGWEAT